MAERGCGAGRGRAIHRRVTFEQIFSKFGQPGCRAGQDSVWPESRLSGQGSCGVVAGSE